MCNTSPEDFDFCFKAGLGRSDSGIDQQSLFMDNCREHGYDLTNNVEIEECYESGIKRIIEISSLIRAIEQQLNLVKCDSDNDTDKIYCQCSSPKCEQELTSLNDSWIRNELMSLAREQEQVNIELSLLNKELFKIENIQIPNALNGMTIDQLEGVIAEYYNLKSLLVKMAKNSSSAAIIGVVKQLEPLSNTVEQYFSLSQEQEIIHGKINFLMNRKSSMQEKRNQLSKLIQLSTNKGLKINYIPKIVRKSSSKSNLNGISHNNNNSHNDVLPNIPLVQNIHNSKKYMNVDENEYWKSISRPAFGITEECPISFEECMTDIQEEFNLDYNRDICHEYVNNEIIAISKNPFIQTPKIHVTCSSFPSESIIIVQVKAFDLCSSLQIGRQYRIRLQQLNGDGSDWFSISTHEPLCHVMTPPHFLLPVKWDPNNLNLSLIFEIQLLDCGAVSHVDRYIFHVLPQCSVQNISVSMHNVDDLTINPKKLINSNSIFMARHRLNHLKPRPTSSTIYDKIPQNLTREVHLSKNLTKEQIRIDISCEVKLNHNATEVSFKTDCTPIQISKIRRSKTYSHDHQYCENLQSCSSNDFLRKSIHKSIQNSVPSNLDKSHKTRNFTAEIKFSDESGYSSSKSSFKRQSPLRQPIRIKRHLSEREINKNSQMTDLQLNDQILNNLWLAVSELYLGLNLCSKHYQKLTEYACFKRKHPIDVIKLYDYFVKIVFESDNKVLVLNEHKSIPFSF